MMKNKKNGFLKLRNICTMTLCTMLCLTGCGSKAADADAESVTDSQTEQTEQATQETVIETAESAAQTDEPVISCNVKDFGYTYDYITSVVWADGEGNSYFIYEQNGMYGIAGHDGRPIMDTMFSYCTAYDGNGVAYIKTDTGYKNYVLSFLKDTEAVVSQEVSDSDQYYIVSVYPHDDGKEMILFYDPEQDVYKYSSDIANNKGAVMDSTQAQKLADAGFGSLSKCYPFNHGYAVLGGTSGIMAIDGEVKSFDASGGASMRFSSALSDNGWIATYLQQGNETVAFGFMNIDTGKFVICDGGGSCVTFGHGGIYVPEINGYALINVSNGERVFDLEKGEYVSGVYQDIDISQYYDNDNVSLYLYETSDGKWGYLDENFKPVGELYDDATAFGSAGYAMVTNKGESYFINSSFEQVSETFASDGGYLLEDNYFAVIKGDTYSLYYVNKK